MIVFPAHAPTDAAFAHTLSAFLETGCDATCSLLDSEIKPGEDLLSAAELGLSADVLILLLSNASTLPRWPLERWQSILFTQAAEVGTRVAVFLREECAFPALLRRNAKLFDATQASLPALRRLKRWLWSTQHETPPDMTFSDDLESLYSEVADHPGIVTCAGAVADRFAHEAARDFEAVLWVPAHRRTPAQIAGDLGSALEMSLDGPLEENCERIRETLSHRRYLAVFDAPDAPLDALMPNGRTSFLITTEPVRISETASSLSAARQLVTARRFAEAYELLTQLFERDIDTESCARELVWICDHWGRYTEASALRNHFRLPPSEQLSLFDAR